MIIKNLIEGTLIKRYKRFLADIKLKDTNEIITAHCPNSGSMKSLNQEGNRVWVTKTNNPKRKLKYTWEIVETPNKALAVVNTQLPNRIVKEAIENRQIKELQTYEGIKTEVKYGEENSRIDIQLIHKKINKTTSKPTESYVEVKNVTLAESERPTIAQFPDAKTIRGQKHLRELALEAKKDNKAYLFYLINRTDCEKIKVAEHIDPVYKEELIKAKAQGVKILPYKTKIHIKDTTATISVDTKIRFIN